jgi:hypothetical protein
VVFANGTDWPGILGGDPPNRGIISAVAADGSHELWHFDTPFSPNASGVAVANGVVYFQSMFGTFYALNAQTGAPMAQVLTGSLTSGPAVSRGQVYLGTGDAAFTFLTGAPLGSGSVMALGIPEPAPAPVLRRVLPRVSVSDATVSVGTDGWATMTFEVRLSAPADRAVAIRYATADGTARAGSDYRRVSAVVRFAAGEMVKTVTVRVRADRLSGDSETFRLKLSRSAGLTLDDGVAIGTIRRT